MIKKAEENKEIEDIDNTDGVGDIINIVKNKLITLTHSDIELINNPLIKKAIKIFKSLVGFLSISKDKTNSEELKKEEQPLIETQPKKNMARTKMVAQDYYRSQIQRYPRARFAAPKEHAIRDNKQGKLKIKKYYLN